MTKDDIQNAKELLTGVECKMIKERTQCILQYTWSDLYRLDGQMSKAKECAQKSLELAEQKQLSYLMKCATKRQILLVDDVLLNDAN